jgi:DNA-binding transcriptional LysR family regulator
MSAGHLHPSDSPTAAWIASYRSIRQIVSTNHFDKADFEMRSLNLDQLRTLLEVVEVRSFSAAARRLNLTQPAVSQHIQELERRFGVRLIERMGKQAHATAPGRELVAAAHQIFRDCELAETTMRRFRDGWIGRVHLGTTNTAMTYVLPPILRRLRLDHPGIDLLVTNMATRESIEQIVENKIDLALVTLPVEERKLRITLLRPQMLVAILPASMADVPDEITPDYVMRQPFILEHERGAVRSLVTEWLSGQMPLRAVMQLGTIEALKTAVESNLGISIVPEMSIIRHSPDISVRPLRPAVPCPLALIEHRNKPNEPALQIVRNALLELRVESQVELPPRRGAKTDTLPRTDAASPKGSRARAGSA